MPGLKAQPQVSVLGQLGAPRVDDDQLGAAQVAARFILLPMIGCASGALEPMMNSTSLNSISPIELVIAPEPNVAARPATVGACQVRAQ